MPWSKYAWELQNMKLTVYMQLAYDWSHPPFSLGPLPWTKHCVPLLLSNVSQFIDLNTTHRHTWSVHQILLNLLISLTSHLYNCTLMDVSQRDAFHSSHSQTIYVVVTILVWCAIRYYRCPLPVTMRHMDERAVVFTSWFNQIVKHVPTDTLICADSGHLDQHKKSRKG